MSKGEGHERRIEVFKTDCKSPENINETNTVTGNCLSSDVNMTEVSSSTSVEDTDVIASETESNILNVVSSEMSSLDEQISRSHQPCEEAIDNTTDAAEHVDMNDVTETAAVLDETSSTVSMLCCSNCGRQIPQLNYQLHSLHCKTSAAKSRSKKSKDASLDKVMRLLSSRNNI